MIPWWVLFVVVLVFAAGYACLAIAIWPRQTRYRFQQAVRKHVIVHTHGGRSLDGVLAGLYSDGIALEHAIFLRSGEPDVPLDGAQLLTWASIDWIQELTDARAEE